MFAAIFNESDQWWIGLILFYAGLKILSALTDLVQAWAERIRKGRD